MASPGTIAIVGAGSIGAGWALLFAAAGHPVRLYDASAARCDEALREIADRAADLHRFDLCDTPPAEIRARVTTVPDLGQAVLGADHVQECVPEDLELKRRLFAELDALAPAGCPIASSSSFMPASRLAADLPGRARCLVVHPGNPPFLLRVAEVVPAPFTAPETVERTEALLRGAGIAPIRVAREVEGFVFNRLQGAVLREAYCLVRDGVATVADIDRLMRDGLGLRWATIGPFETVDLNTRGGIAAHAERMGPAYARMGAERGQDDPWTPELVAEVAEQRRTALPLDRLGRARRLARPDADGAAAGAAGGGAVIRFDGRQIAAHPGQTVAAALAAAGIRAFRTTRHGAPRGLFCGMGVCHDCLVTIDGRPNQRACMAKITGPHEVSSQVALPTLAIDGEAGPCPSSPRCRRGPRGGRRCRRLDRRRGGGRGGSPGRPGR